MPSAERCCQSTPHAEAGKASIGDTPYLVRSVHIGSCFEQHGHCLRAPLLAGKHEWGGAVLLHRVSVLSTGLAPFTTGIHGGDAKRTIILASTSAPDEIKRLIAGKEPSWQAMCSGVAPN